MICVHRGWEREGNGPVCLVHAYLEMAARPGLTIAMILVFLFFWFSSTFSSMFLRLPFFYDSTIMNAWDGMGLLLSSFGVYGTVRCELLAMTAVAAAVTAEQ